MELNRYRIGNDVPLKWTITRGDEPEDLTIVASVRVFVVCPMWECEVPYIIGGADNNEVTVLFKGKEQKYCGPYWLRLEENRGEDNMNTIESRAAFELRPVTDTAAIMPVAVTELATDIMMPGHGLSAYQIAVLHGYQGTEEEWLAGIVGRKGVNDYSLLGSKPKINGHELVGNKSSEELGIVVEYQGPSITKICDYLYDIDYETLDYGYAAEHIDGVGASEAGGCSVLRVGNIIGRKFDWHDDYRATFIVRTKNSKGRYASVGAGGIDELTVQAVDARDISDAYKLLPFRVVDGVNEMHLFAEANVVPTRNNTATTPSVEYRERVNARMLVRYILDHFASVDEAVNYLRNYVSIIMSESLHEMGYESHYMIADSTKCVVLEVINNAIVVVDSDISTNFHVGGVSLLADGSVYTNADAPGHVPTSIGIDEYGSGLERWNELVERKGTSGTIPAMRDTMEELNYSNAYTKTLGDGFWYSEFVGLIGGVDISVDTPTTDTAFVSRINAAKAAWQVHTKDDSLMWISTHSAVYNIEDASLLISVQEDGEYHAIYIDQKQDTISDLDDIREGAEAGATAVQPAAMQSALATKQDTLTAGDNIVIDGNTISATAEPPVAGTGITINGNVISANIANSLASTATDHALSAAKGKELFDDVQAIKALQDVKKVFATASDMVGTGLSDGDQVKVLKDETQSNDTTIYTYNGSTFDYVGSVGEYATKAEFDELSSEVTRISDSANEADLGIADENGNVLARFENGHIRTKNFDSSKNNANIGIDDVPVFNQEEDYDVGDVVMYDGLMYKFTSAHEAGEWDDTQVEQTNVMQGATYPVDVQDSENIADLDVTDENGNVLARFENGHFRTKNFDSAKCDFLKGKKILFFGDSQTFYDNYVKAFVNMTGCIAYRRGYPGSGFENGATTGTTISFCDRVDAAEDNDLGIITDYSQLPSHIGLPSEIDYVILQGGTNDFGKWETNKYSSSNSFGEINEIVNKNSFVGAIRYVLTKLKEKYPFAPIFVTGINYTYRVNGGVLDLYATNVVTSVLDDPNSEIQLYEIPSLGKNVNDFNEAMKLVSSLYGAYYVDLTSIGYSSIFQNDRERFTFDGLHFSEHGGKLVAKKIFIEMKNNLIY